MGRQLQQRRGRVGPRLLLRCVCTTCCVQGCGRATHPPLRCADAESAGDDTADESSDEEDSAFPARGQRSEEDLIRMIQHLLMGDPGIPPGPMTMDNTMKLQAQWAQYMRCAVPTPRRPAAAPGRFTRVVVRRLNKRVHVCASCGCRCSYREIKFEDLAFSEV